MCLSLRCEANECTVKHPGTPCGICCRGTRSGSLLTWFDVEGAFDIGWCRQGTVGINSAIFTWLQGYLKGAMKAVR